MDVEGEERSDLEVDEHDSMDDLIRDRFRLNAISIAEAEAGPVVACVADLAFKYAGVINLQILFLESNREWSMFSK
ncbi:hypothetical protein AALP_AA2G034900 [Arabis alpina]|uniref:Uncharacterized protein n=1 Tax=Arabis alpina TaxID=50452 RepID=A0A087HF38_ARAAL|nr:hypothetical protein AALP_AA2G034900 [Arabis alpina]